MTTKTPRTAKAAAVSGTPSFRLECMTLLAASLERELDAAQAENERLREIVVKFEQLLDGTEKEIGIMSTTDGYYEWSKHEPYIELRALARDALAEKGEKP